MWQHSIKEAKEHEEVENETQQSETPHTRGEQTFLRSNMIKFWIRFSDRSKKCYLQELPNLLIPDR